MAETTESTETTESSATFEANLSVSEFKGFTQPMCKLVEAIRAGIGIIYEPTRVRLLARANADAATIAAESDATLLKLRERMEKRVYANEMRRQKNIESVTQKALACLPASVSDRKVDEDWTATFFQQCQDVKSEEMQLLWARLLAGEVAQPGSYSVRTLNLIKTLSVDEANLFTKLCCFTWTIGDLTTPVLYEGTPSLEAITQLEFGDIAHLVSIGLVQNETTGYSITFNREKSVGEPRLLAKYFERSHDLKMPAGECQLKVGNVLLTAIGRELAPIAGASPNEEYRAAVIARWKREKIEVTDTPLPG